MKVVLTERIEKRREFEVTFPIYRRHDIDLDEGASTIFSRVEQYGGAFRQFSVTLRGDAEAELQITTISRFDHDSHEYFLGLGEYASSEEEFAKALQAANSIIDRMEAGLAVPYRKGQ